MTDALAWFGKEDLPNDMKDLAEGKSTIQEQVMEAGEAVTNRLVNSIRPDTKLLYETLTGKSTWPDAFSPRPIRDKVKNILRTFKLDKPYDYLAGRPKRGGDTATEHFLSDLLSVVAYNTEPGVQAYYDTRSKVFDWNDKHGDDRGGRGSPSKRGNTLYYYRQAMKYGDLPAAEKYLRKYYDMGGTPRGLRQSIKNAHPLSGIDKVDRFRFRKQLGKGDQKRLEMALKWYRKTYYNR